MDSVVAVSTHYKRLSFLSVHNRSPFCINIKVAHARSQPDRYNKYGVCIDDVDGLPTDEEKKAIIVINQHRINNGVEPFIWDQGAQVFAETRAIETRYRCENFNQFDHVRPDGSGANEVVAMVHEWSMIGILQKPYAGWLNEALHFSSSGPCISNWDVNLDNGKDVTKSWINSPGHNYQLFRLKRTLRSCSILWRRRLPYLVL